MSLEWFLPILIVAVGNAVFGPVERGASLPRCLGRWLGFLGITGLLSFAGGPWTLIWVLGLPGAGASFHLWWCLTHGINPLTAEPKEKYYRLRGWTSEEQCA